MKTSLIRRKGMHTLLAFLPLFVLSNMAMAFTAPSSGSFGYTLYDTVLLKMIGGPLGWVGAAMLIVYGISNIMSQWMMTVVCIVGATCIIKMNTIITSLGAVVE